jgi:hypothetical protein
VPLAGGVPQCQGPRRSAHNKRGLRAECLLQAECLPRAECRGVPSPSPPLVVGTPRSLWEWLLRAECVPRGAECGAWRVPTSTSEVLGRSAPGWGGVHPAGGVPSAAPWRGEGGVPTSGVLGRSAYGWGRSASRGSAAEPSPVAWRGGVPARGLCGRSA